MGNFNLICNIRISEKLYIEILYNLGNSMTKHSWKNSAFKNFGPIVDQQLWYFHHEKFLEKHDVDNTLVTLA